MLKLTRSIDERCGNDRRDADRRGAGKTLDVLAAVGPPSVIVAYMLVLITFGLDVVVPLGTEVSLLYLIPLGFVALWSSPKQSSHVMVIAAICAGLTLIGFFFMVPDNVWTAVANRLFAVIVIGIMAMLSVVRKRAEDDLKVLQGLLPICAYCKKIRDDRGRWEHIERYIADRSAADFSHGMCPDCGVKHFPEIFTPVPLTGLGSLS
jgi:hypothetical protein